MNYDLIIFARTPIGLYPIFVIRAADAEEGACD